MYQRSNGDVFRHRKLLRSVSLSSPFINSILLLHNALSINVLMEYTNCTLSIFVDIFFLFRSFIYSVRVLGWESGSETIVSWPISINIVRNCWNSYRIQEIIRLNCFNTLLLLCCEFCNRSFFSCLRTNARIEQKNDYTCTVSAVWSTLHGSRKHLRFRNTGWPRGTSTHNTNEGLLTFAVLCDVCGCVCG